MDYQSEYRLFQRTSYGILQCLQGIKSLEPQTKEVKILPFFHTHLRPLMDNFRSAFMTNSLHRTNIQLIHTYASRIAQDSVWHLQKTICGFIKDIVYSRLNMEDKVYIINGSIRQAKSKYGRRLVRSTISEFQNCMDNLWENMKTNECILMQMKENKGIQWFREQFQEYLSTDDELLDARYPNRTTPTDCCNSNNEPFHRDNTSIQEFGITTFERGKRRNFKGTLPVSRTKSSTYKSKDTHKETSRTIHEHTGKINTVISKRNQISESFVRANPKQAETVRRLNLFVEQMLTSPEAQFQFLECLLDLFKTGVISVIFDFTDTMLFQILDRGRLTFHCDNVRMQTKIMHLLHHLPGTTSLTTQTPSTPTSDLSTRTRTVGQALDELLDPPTATNTTTLPVVPLPTSPSIINGRYTLTDRLNKTPLQPQRTDPLSPTYDHSSLGDSTLSPLTASTPLITLNPANVMDSSTIDLNIIMLDEFIATFDFGTPQRTEVLDTLHTLLKDQIITNPNMVMNLDGEDNVLFTPETGLIHFHFPLTDPTHKTDDILHETLTLLRALPGLPVSDTITYSSSEDGPRIPLYHVRTEDTTNRDWPSVSTDSNPWDNGISKASSNTSVQREIPTTGTSTAPTKYQLIDDTLWARVPNTLTSLNNNDDNNSTFL